MNSPTGRPNWLDPAHRRNFLKLAAASLAFAGITACTKQPKETIVPYVRQPEEFVPGIPLYYATAMQMGGVGTGLLVDQPSGPADQSGRQSRSSGQPRRVATISSKRRILTMYDPDRAQAVIKKGLDQQLGRVPGRAGRAAREGADQARRRAADSHRDGDVAHADGRRSTRFSKNCPARSGINMKRAGRHGAYQGAVLAFGKPVNTIYHFDQADVIVSLDADFLACGPGNLRLRAPVRRQAPRAEQRHAHAATQGRLAGRLSGRARSRRAPINRRSMRRTIAGRCFAPAGAGRGESRRARRR